MADIKNFGIKGLAADVQMGKSGGRIKYDATNGRFDLTQADGTTLENIRVGTVVAGSWTGTEIGTQYGGTGQDFSSSTGIVSFTNGVASAGTVDLGNASFVTGTVALANGGTGASTASGARTNLGLGSIATQDLSNINITGGSIDGTTIGGSSAAAITGTTVTANSGFTGDLTGDVVGDLTGDVTGILTGDVKASDNSVMVDSSAKTFAGALTGDVTGNVTGDLTGTADDADGLSSAVTVAISGDATGSATFQDAGDTATISTTLAASGVTAGTYGSNVATPVLTIDSKGRVTSASTVTITSGFNLAGDAGNTDVIVGGETLTVEGTANQIETTVTDNHLEIGIVDGAEIANLTVTGTFTSDDITSSQVSVNGDAIITGNLIVQGTQTTVESTTVQAADPIFRVNSDGTTGTDVGFEANVGGSMKQIVYLGAGSKWSVGSESFVASTFEGNLTGDVTGDVTGDLTGDVTGNLTGNVTGDVTGDLTGDVFSSLGQKVLESGTDGSNATFTGDVTGDLTGDVTGQVSDISNHDTDDLSEGTGNLYWTTARGNAAVEAYLTGGTGIDYASGTIDLADTAVTAGTYGSTTAIPTFTVDAQGRLTSAGEAAVSIGMNLAGDTGSEALSNGDTIKIAGGTNITTVASSPETVTVNLDGAISLTSVTASGAITGGSLTDGTATLSSGALSGATTVTASGAVTGGSITDGTATLSSGSITGGVAATFSGAIQGGSLSDGTATLSSGALSGATTGSFSGNVSAANFDVTGVVEASSADISGEIEFGSLSDGSIQISGFVDEDNMASDSATLIPTQQSVKAYVDAVVTAEDLDFSGDTGTGAVDLDSQTLAITGGNNITTAASGQGLSVALDTSLSGLSSVVSTSFSGNLTGNVTGQVSDISNHDTDDLAEGSNLYFTDSRARQALSVTNVSGDGSLAYNASTGVFSYTGPSAAEVRAHFTGGTGITITAGQVDLDDTAVTPGAYGSATAVPNITVDQQGRITGMSTSTIATGFNVDGDNGSSDVILGGETLNIVGTANQIETTITNNQVEVGIVDGAEVANLTVTGTFTSDDITSATVNVNGDAVITGNLTVQGTQTIVDSTTVATNDAIIRVNGNGTTGTDVGLEANVGGVFKQFVYDGATNKWTVGSENMVANRFEGDLTGDVTGTVTDISNHDTDDLSEGGTNLYFTEARARSAISVTDNGGDGSLSYSSATGVITYNGPSASEVRAHFTGSTGVTISAGNISIGQDVATSSDVTFNNVTATANFIGDVVGQVSDLSNHDTGDLAEGTNLYYTTARANSAIAAYTGGLTNLGGDVTTTGDVSAVDVTASGTVSFGSITDGSTTITGFVDEDDMTSDSATLVPTQQSVKAYVDANAPDGLLVRASLTSGSTTINTPAIPNVAGRAYYASKVVIKVGTAFSGGSFNHILVKENNGSGTLLVEADDADAATAGTYSIELDGDLQLTAGQAVQVQFMQSDGVTSSTTTAGSGTVTVHYNWV